LMGQQKVRPEEVSARRWCRPAEIEMNLNLSY
jgi:hypothetical protein